MHPTSKQTFIRDKAYHNLRDLEGTYILWSRHATQGLIADGLTRAQVERALQSCEIIEDYPTVHRPLPDCLVLGWLSIEEPIHAVVAIDERQERIFIVTVYRPDMKEWKNDWRTRK
jgi:hypothetical protein